MTFTDIAEVMGLKFRKTDSENNYWFDFNGQTILVMFCSADTLEEAEEYAARVVLQSLGKILSELM